MTCTSCRRYFCWLCLGVLSKVNPYSHFNNPNSPCYNQWVMTSFLFSHHFFLSFLFFSSLPYFVLHSKHVGWMLLLSSVIDSSMVWILMKKMPSGVMKRTDSSSVLRCCMFHLNALYLSQPSLHLYSHYNCGSAAVSLPWCHHLCFEYDPKTWIKNIQCRGVNCLYLLNIWEIWDIQVGMKSKGKFELLSQREIQLWLSNYDLKLFQFGIVV